MSSSAECLDDSPSQTMWRSSDSTSSTKKTWLRKTIDDGLQVTTAYDKNRYSIFLHTGMFCLPTGNGKLKDLTRFDAAMFGVHPKQAHAMDPQLRMLLEVVYEAIADAGVYYAI